MYNKPHPKTIRVPSEGKETEVQEEAKASRSKEASVNGSQANRTPIVEEID